MLGNYKSWIFDCDGVLLNSNRVKTLAMFEAARPFGETEATRLVAYHQANGGISRFEKFHYFFATMLGRNDYDADMTDALARFSELSRVGLMDAPEADGLGDLLVRIAENGARAFVVSGGMQQEIRDVFEARGLAGRFTGIFGSPDSKDQILERELANKGVMKRPAVFVGDSRYDHQAASRHGLDFVFASAWSEFSDWPDYFADTDVTVVEGIGDLVHGSS